MIDLIKNEVTKIIHKKSTYILLLITFIYVFFTNIIYKNNLLDSFYTFKDLLVNFFNEYELLIVVVISFISSNILIEEYKGTIKQLLIVPYNRVNILLSKYITMLIVLIIYILLIVILQLIFGYLLLDTNNLNTLINNYKIYKYFILLILSKLPIFIFIISFIMLLSTILTNNILSIMITLFIYISTPLINGISYKINIFKYFITEHYDYGRFIIDNINIDKSIIIYVMYLILIIFTSIIIFKNKDIQNI